MSNYKTCPVCKQDFGHDYKASRLRKTTYCSHKCRAQDLIKADPSKRSIFTCEWCNQKFEEWTYRQPRFCSNQCRSEYGAKQPRPSTRRPENFLTLECEQCGHKYTVHKCMNEGDRQSRFCSRKCVDLWISENQVKENHPKYKGGAEHPNRGTNWSRQRRAALKRDGRKCRVCGYTENNKEHRFLDVHHIIPYREFDGDYKRANRISNLIVLCRSCHFKVEFGEIECPRP